MKEGGGEQFLNEKYPDSQHLPEKDNAYFTEEQKGELLDDLRKVGPEKPVGYLPLNTLVNICGVSLSEMEDYAEEKGLDSLFLCEKDSKIEKGALYIYDKVALGKLLKNNQKTLLDAGWPIEPEEFVRHLKVHAMPGTDIYELIADAFADKNNPNRRDYQQINNKING